MNFVDATLVQLADPATRNAIFDATALEQMLNATYDTQSLALQGPFNAIFDELRLGFALPRFSVVEGRWNPVGGVTQTEIRLNISGVGGTDHAISAWWRGGIVARAAPANDTIIEARTSWPELGNIDAEIITALGALPANSVALEQERRTRLLAHVQATFSQPALFDDSDLDAWLRDEEAASVGELLSRAAGIARPGTLTLRFSPPSPVAPSPRLFPISAAILIRDVGLSISETLAQSKSILEETEVVGLNARPDTTLRPRRTIAVIWIVPETLFDDDDWPGGTAAMTAPQRRAVRRTQAGLWLAQEGIGLAVRPP